VEKNRPILVTGAKGMLGSDLVLRLQKEFGQDKVIAADRATLDICSWQDVGQVIRSREPWLVVNAAAYTNVDGAEKEREDAYNINVMGPANLVEWCEEYGAKLVHFSTDQVFDGKGNVPRTEEETPSPSNYYAETKWLGEKEVARLPSALTLRVQWLYGKRKDRFTPLKDKEVFTPFKDQLGAPMWTETIADTVVELVRRDIDGLIHLTHDDYASWADVFQFVKEEMGYSVRLEPKATAEVKLPAVRPLFSVLSNRKLCSALGRENFGSWRPALLRFLKTT